MNEQWDRVDEFLTTTVVGTDETLAAVRAASHAAGLPEIEVAPNQGALLALWCRMAGARRVLEFGTLGGYSAIHLARAVGPQGRVVTLELEPRHAAVALENLRLAGVQDIVQVIQGPAADSAQRLIEAGVEPFDLVFIDADKPNNPRYLEQAIRLSHPGTVIVVDNVVRSGRIADPDDQDERVSGSREVLRLIGEHPALTGTAVQTVGSKGWDGFALAVVGG